MVMADDSVKKFQPSKWMTYLEDEQFKARVLEIMDEEVIQKFDLRTGDADEFYSSPDESSLTDSQ